MKRVLSILLPAILLFCSGCEKDDIPPYTGPAERTVIVYFAADNDLARFALDDIKELEKGLAGFDDQNYNLLVYKDVGSGYETELFRLYRNKKGEVEKEVLRSYDDQNSVNPEIMKSILSEAFTTYPAESYGLILWSHAEGWIEAKSSSRSFGQDGNNYMNIADLNAVLKTCPHFEYIYFEACFMSCVEVLYELHGVTDYFIASPTETPGPGAPYDLILPAMFAKENAAVKITEIYYEDYKEKYEDGRNLTNYNWTAGASLAAIKSDALVELASATQKILPEYIPENNAPIPVNNILYYDKRSSTRYYYDMDQFIKSITGGNEDYKAWRSVYDKAVVCFKTTPRNYSKYVNMFSMEGSTGLSMYVPRAAQASLLPFYQTYEWYRDGGWAQTGW